MRLIVNVIPATGVNTGIGRYLRCLYEHIQREFGQELSIGYFDGQRVLDAMPEPAQSVAGRSRLLKLIWSLPPAAGLSLRLAHLAKREWHFRQAAKHFDIYHEAAFFPFPSPGRGQNRVHHP